MNDVFARRREYTDGVFKNLTDHIRATIGSQYDEVIGDHTFLYATGSCGRGEMGEGSDLDAYVVHVGTVPAAGSDVLRRAVESANAAANLPPLDADGKHLKTALAGELIDRLGAPEDDASEEGTFTKRMLLLLESRVMLGEDAHTKVVGEVIDAYWQNADLHPSNYQPFVLVNDIVRWWRVVLLNHESRLRKREHELKGDRLISTRQKPRILLAERRYRSYKMRLARCLTCYSALTYLLALTPDDLAHVSKHQVREMTRLPPLARLEKLSEIAGRELEAVPKLLSSYASYLERTADGKDRLLAQLRDNPETPRELSEQGGDFTRLMFELVQELGGGRRLHRHMLV